MQWPVVFAMVATAIGLVYYFAPDAEQEWVWITPGSILAAALWVVVSLGFRLYLQYFGNYNETYGALGAIIVVLTWFYLSGVAILTGAELNAEIEHASPYGKNPGEKVPGEKRKIGILAAREFEKKMNEGGVIAPPLPDEVNCDLDRPAKPPGQPGLKPSELVIGAAMLLPVAWRIVKKVREDVAGDSHRDAA
jgi:membrane protein